MTDVSDVTEQTLPGTGPSPESAATTGSTRSARGGSLSSKLLPELQQIAGGLGISTTKMKKSDLVAAIQAARAGSSTASSPAPAASAPAGEGEPRPRRQSRSAGGSTTVDTAAAAGEQSSAAASSGPVAEAPADSDPPAPTRRERPRRDRSGTSDGQTASVPAVAATGAAGSDGAVAGDAPQGERPGRTERSDRADNNGQRNQNGNGQRTQNDGGQRNQNGNNGGGQNNGAQNNGSQNNNGAQRNQNNGGQNQNGNSGGGQNQNNGGGQRNNQNDDDDFEGGGRRGRRYRDRRGRNRDRNRDGQGGGNNDVEPTVSEDDVLVPVAGILDCVEDKNNWFVRVEGYYASTEDVYVANSFVRRFNLRRGDAVTGTVRQVKEGERREKYNPLVRLDTVNGKAAEQGKQRVEFTKLTPLYPQERLRLETEPHILTTRVIDLVMPIGKGQRALIVSPPKAGKTMVMQSIANAITTNNPECHLMVVLVDERPEEVTDMQRSVKGEVIASTFDRRPIDHTTVAELSIERAKRLVEMGHDVVVLLDSITRLGRAYNLAAPASGRILSGGVDSTALYQPKRFLGAARNIENGGSLTIIATALVETGSAGDTVFFEEYKGTGNAELKLDRKIADKRTFPAVDVDQSSTRKEEILLSPDELAVTIKLRRVLHALEPQQAIELLLDRLRKTRTNIEFLMQIAKTTPGGD